MKQANKLLLCMLSLCLVIACSKSKDGLPSPVEEIREGVVTPAGTPIESQINEISIGAAGGTLYSTDGRLQLIVPPGAVKQSYTFSIQRITNTNPLGKGVAYRMQPHGIQFAVPVKMIIKHDDQDRRGTIPEALNIAFQDDKGIWQAIGGKQTEAANGSISITTTHFSDYSLFESFALKPGYSEIEPGASAQLEVVSTENLLAVPLTADKTVPIGEPIPVIAHYIKTNTWKLSGEGKLAKAGHRAVYTAPGEPPAENPVTVSVELDLGQAREKLMLVAAIYIADGGELEMSIGGGAAEMKKGYRIVQVKPGLFGIAPTNGYEEDGSVMLIRWKGGRGTHSWNMVASNDVDANYFGYAPQNSKTNFYNSVYIVKEEIYDSGGGVTITDMGETDGYVRGTFAVSPTGFGENWKPSVGISGRFKLKKTW
jgi:hypothetical protein